MAVELWIGTEKGAFVARSDDARGRWSVEGPLFRGWKVTGAVRTPGGRRMAATASRVYGAALQVEEPRGGWRQIAPGPAWPEGTDRKMNQVWCLVPDGDRLWAGVDEAGLFVSTDDGESWRGVDGLNGHPTRRNWFPGAGGLCLHTVLAHPRDRDRLWVGISAVGAWRTDDGGATWAPCNEGIERVIPDEEFDGIGWCVHALALDPRDPARLYRQDHTGMYRSTDGGERWEPAMEGMPSWFGFPVAVDPRTGRLFAFPMESDEFRVPCAGKCAVYVSDDGADTWSPRTDGLPEHMVYAGVLRGAMVVDGLEPCGVYFATTAGDVYASADRGESWQRLPCTLPRVLSLDVVGTD